MWDRNSCLLACRAEAGTRFDMLTLYPMSRMEVHGLECVVLLASAKQVLGDGMDCLSVGVNEEYWMGRSGIPIVLAIVRRRVECLSYSLRSSCLALDFLPRPLASASQSSDTSNPGCAFNPQGACNVWYYRAIDLFADANGTN